LHYHLHNEEYWFIIIHVTVLQKSHIIQALVNTHVLRSLWYRFTGKSSILQPC